MCVSCTICEVDPYVAWRQQPHLAQSAHASLWPWFCLLCRIKVSEVCWLGDRCVGCSVPLVKKLASYCILCICLL